MHRGLHWVKTRLVKVLGLNLLRQHLEFQLRVHVAYRRNEPYMSEGHYGAMHGVERAIWCMNMSLLPNLVPKSHFTKLPLGFLFIYMLIMH
jgi:hypothetical protein